MATTSTDPEKMNPIDQYTQQANDYRNQAKNYRDQSTTIDNQLQQLPNFDYNNFYNEWKAGKKPLVDILTSNYKKPEPEISPEQVEKAKFGASLTDSLSSLAEIVANGKGSMIRNRGNEPTSTQTTNARLQALKDKYDQNLLNYNQAIGSGEMQDFNQQLQSAMQSRGQQRQYLLYKSKEANDNAKEAQKEANQQQKDAADYALKLQDQGIKGKELEEKVRQFNLNYKIDKQKVGIDQYNATTNRQKANADEGNNNLVIPVPAHPNDPNATVNPVTNQRMVNIPIRKKDIDAYYTRAMNDANFFDKHPTLRTGNGVSVPFKDADKNAIAITQAQDEYNSQFGQQPAASNNVSWKFPIIQNTAEQPKNVSAPKSKYSF